MIKSPGNSQDAPTEATKSIGQEKSIPVEQPLPVETKPDTSHTLKVVRFETLARCGDEIWIENEGQIYRLRRTRQGKLILTK